MKQNEFWDKRSIKYEETIRNQEFYKLAIKKTLSQVSKSDRVLDFACASGEITLDVSGYVETIEGIDTSEKMIALAQKKPAPHDNVEFNNEDLASCLGKNKKYSKVLAFNILHLVDDLSSTLSAMYDALENDGVVISATPCLGERGGFVRIIINFMQTIGLAPPILGLTYPQLEQRFKNNEFGIIEKEVLNENDRTLWIVAKKSPKAALNKSAFC